MSGNKFVDNLNYHSIQLPLEHIDFHAMSRADADRYFHWFIEQIPHRITILEQVMRSDPLLHQYPIKWFVPQLRDIETEELFLLTPQTVSLAIDIGMYVGELFVRMSNNLTWEMVKKPQSSADFQQPVVTGFTDGDVLNPVQVMITLAYGFARGSRGPERLLQIYETWEKGVD